MNKFKGILSHKLILMNFHLRFKLKIKMIKINKNFKVILTSLIIHLIKVYNDNLLILQKILLKI